MSSRGFNWKAGSFFIVYHAAILVTLPFYLIYAPPSWLLVGTTLAVVFACGVSLTTLYHRCYSHRACEISWLAELPLLFFGTLIAQGSAIEWAFDHRRHHRHTETDEDPHAITRGFWYAHVLWIFDRRPALDEQLVADLLERPLLRFQHRYYVPCLIVTTALTSSALWLVTRDWLGALYFGGLIRVFLSHHSTFCINSVAHYWGSRPFDASATAADNWFCSLFTFGEGQHNYHHAFPFDYRIGNRWYHWDPGKWTIWTLARLGLATKLKQARESWVARKRGELNASRG